MAVKTVWRVEHEFGDDEDDDLSDKRPSERAGYARWLSGKDCSRCWKKSRGGSSMDKETWLAERRAEEMTAIRTWERRAAMCELDGSDKSIFWGARVRYDLMSAARDYHMKGGGMSDEEFADRLEVPARGVTSASWWIDQRDADPTDIEELLTDVKADPASLATQSSSA
jgi:hypothetical protein